MQLVIIKKSHCEKGPGIRYDGWALGAIIQPSTWTLYKGNRGPLRELCTSAPPPSPRFEHGKDDDNRGGGEEEEERDKESCKLKNKMTGKNKSVEENLKIMVA